jgi:hypothetical protein
MIVEQLQAMIDLRKGMHIPSEMKYSCMEEFVLRNGQLYTPAPFTIETEYRTPKECFCNAFHLSTETGLHYVEGYAFRIIPFMHAWCVDDDGIVYDPTLTDSESVEYFGVKFSHEFVVATILDKETYGVIDNWERRFPLLRGQEFF